MITESVSVTDLSIAAGKRSILHWVNLDFVPGMCHVVLGPSGSGKTTLLRSLNRLVDLFPELSVTGTITVPWDGARREILNSGVAAEEVRRRVGMVFQNPHVLPVTIRENFRIPLRAVLGLEQEEIAARLERTLRQTGLWAEVRDRLDTPAARLSGGQQQRLCLARALALDPAVLLLDEPTANLDFRATAAIEDLILGLKRERLMIVVSHSLDQAARLADRVVVMDEGRVVLESLRRAFAGPAEMVARIERLFAGSSRAAPGV